MFILDADQGSERWLLARLGIATMSKASELITPGGKPTTGNKRNKYLNTLLAEWLTGIPTETFQSYWMARGTELEPESRDLYAMLKDVEPVQVGMVYKDASKLIACSPDALIGDDGLWESKSPAPHNQVQSLLKGIVPTQYIPQIQGQLFVTDREWCDFQSYCPGMPPLIIRVNRDTKFIKTLSEELDCFIDELLEKREKLKAMK